MFRSLFFRRLYLPYVLLVCAVAVILGMLGGFRLHDAQLTQARRLLGSTVNALADQIGEEIRPDNMAGLQADVKRLGQKLGYRITVIGSDPAGTVLADSEADPAVMGPHRYRPEIIMAYSTGEGWYIRQSDTLHIPLLYYAQRITVNRQVAYVRMAVHMVTLDASLWTFYVQIAAVTLGCILFTAIFAYYLARRLAAPIVEVTGFANAVANGVLDHRILRSGKGELGVLARSLNSMADSFVRLLAEAKNGQAELRTILTSMSEGVIATDAQKKILLVNESASRLLLFPREQAEGKPIWELIRQEGIIKCLDEVAASGQRRQFQAELSPGQYLEITICPFVYPQPSTSAPGFIIVTHDVTQTMRYQELRKEFVANVSHELRTPLTVIKGFVETLRDGAINDPQKRDEYLATIERHATQLGNLVTDLLELSRLENQAGLPRRTSVDLNGLIRKAMEMLQPAIAAKTHKVDAKLPEQTPPVAGNSDYLERAVINLLENAIKYTPAGGQISIALSTDAKHAIIEVVDNGIGIPAADISRLFERFYRVDRSRSREMGGTGLGLAIVKHVVQAHGGSVEVTSELNVGSRFRIILPLVIPEA